MKKFKSTEMNDFAPKELSEDLINEVLLRLPARSIGRFRCVSKPWRTLLSSSKFARSHLNFHLHRSAPIVALPAEIGQLKSQRTAQPVHLLTFPANGGDGGLKKVTFPRLGRCAWMVVEAACHGIVLVELEERGRNHGRYVVNPVTLESFELPDSDLSVTYEHDMYGMGYDKSSKDYKIVQLLRYETDSDPDSDSDEFEGTIVEVYSMKKKAWKRVAKSPYDHYLPHSESDGEDPGVFMNGFLHWVALDSGEGYVISAFSLATEEFDKVPLPKDFRADSSIKHLAVLRGCFAIVCNSSNDCTEVWLMKEYGVQESWEKLVIDTRGRNLKISVVLSLSSEDEFVLVQLLDSFFMKLVGYSLVTGIWRDVVVDGIPDEFDQRVVNFTESLLSPNNISD